MKACPSCGQENGDDARFCLQCGGGLSSERTSGEASPQDDLDLWRKFIGRNGTLRVSPSAGFICQPSCDRYIQKFRKFRTGTNLQFAPSWHWPAFFFHPFLWFLYRKMYMYALVYLVGEIASVFLTGNPMVEVVWHVVAGLSANYLYCWHVKENLDQIRKRVGFNINEQHKLVEEEGGVQPYVVWIGVAVYLLQIGMGLAMMEALFRGELPINNEMGADSPPKFN